MLTSRAPRRHATRALFAVLVLGSAVTANPLPRASKPCPAPCPPAECPPCTSGASSQPRIVVNVPPPEIVYQDMPAQAACRQPLFSRCGLFQRHHAVPMQVPQQTVSFAPLQQTVTTGSLSVLNAGALSLGAANVGLSGVSLANVVPVQQVQQVQQVQSASSSGLAAIHQAELYAASVAAGRAQQDAEMRVMMSALDRARGSMAAQSAASQAGIASTGGCPEASCESIKTLIAATTANSQQIGVLATKMDKLQQRLDALTLQVESLAKEQTDMQKRQLDMLKTQALILGHLFPDAKKMDEVKKDPLPPLPIPPK